MQELQSGLIAFVGLILAAATVIMRKTVADAHKTALPVLQNIEADIRNLDKKLDQLGFQYSSILEKHSNLARHVDDLEKHYDLQAEARNARIEKLELFTVELRARLRSNKSFMDSEEGRV